MLNLNVPRTDTGAQGGHSPEESKEASSSKENTPTLTAYTDSNASVLLQMAVALVSGTNRDTEVLVRILFDSGSQRSYITEHAREKLGVPTVKSEKLLIRTFDQENEQLQTSEVVELSVRGLDKNESIPVTAYTIPLVCTPLQDQSIEVAQQKYEDLVDLDFADDPLVQCGSQVDLLIGNDFYWTFFTGGIKWGESGPVAMESKLGWILSGLVSRKDMSSVSTNVVSSHTL